jgi:hypothetical protein
MNQCQATIEEGESFLVAFKPRISIEVFFINKSNTNPAQINLVIGNQTLQPVILDPNGIRSKRYNIGDYTGITFTNVAVLQATPVEITVQQTETITTYFDVQKSDDSLSVIVNEIAVKRSTVKKSGFVITRNGKEILTIDN